MSPRRAAPAALLLLALASPGRTQDALPAKCAPPDPAKLQNWEGVWVSEYQQAAISGATSDGTLTLDQEWKLVGITAPWTVEGWLKFGVAFRIGSGGGKQAGWGYPMMMNAPAPLKFVISPTETVITSQYRDIRYIYTDGRKHPSEEDRWPNSWGDSIGCWEGDTLVIETVDVKQSTNFNYWAPPLSDRARYVERLRRVAPDRIEAEFTITDPEMLERPWQVKMAYRHAAGLNRIVHDADMFDNDRTGREDGAFTIEPPKEEDAPAPFKPAEIKLSQAELDRVAGHYTVDGAPLAFTFERRGERLYLRISPVLTVFIPVFAEAPLRFAGIDGDIFTFTTDAAGKVTGVQATSRIRPPVAATRAKT